MKGLWDNISDAVQKLPQSRYPHSLPKNTRRLKDKLKQYKDEGYGVLIHKGFGHKNSEKINDEAKAWVISRWADRVKKVANHSQLLQEYNTMAKVQNWKELKDENTLYLFLNQEEIVHLWYGNRYGEKVFKEKFTVFLKTKMPTMRDSLWYSDGTKMNLWYLNEEGKPETCQVYEVMDAYSEVFLGYHVSKTENYQAQYGAYKMAAAFSGHRPYELKFDNQGGHKKLKTGNFLTNICRISVKSQPYNGKSKSIENAFGIFQRTVMKKLWFFTGQNIQAKRQESKVNREFIQANIKNLPTLKEAIQDYVECRNEWNASKHHATGVPKIEMYQNSTNPETPEIGLHDMVDLFWIQRPKPIMYSAYGLSFVESKVKYHYMKYEQSGLPDMHWHVRNIDKKFVIKFDPDDMSMIYLYEDTPKGLIFNTEMTTKVEVQRNKQEQEAYDTWFTSEVIRLNKELRIGTQNEIDTIQEAHGMLPEQYGLNSPKLAGLKTEKKERKRQRNARLADSDKTISNMVVPISEEEGQDPNYFQMY